MLESALLRRDSGAVVLTPAGAQDITFVLEVAGGHLCWSLRAGQRIPIAVLFEPVGAQDWLWAVYGERVALAVAEEVSVDFPIDPALAERARDYVLAAGATTASTGLLLAAGTTGWDWRRCPPGLLDASEHAVSWQLFRDHLQLLAPGADRRLQAHSDEPSTGFLDRAILLHNQPSTRL